MYYIQLINDKGQRFEKTFTEYRPYQQFLNKLKYSKKLTLCGHWED